eukprot:15458123-Alexandrium_andersonii.AAC.1
MKEALRTMKEKPEECPELGVCRSPSPDPHQVSFRQIWNQRPSPDQHQVSFRQIWSQRLACQGAVGQASGSDRCIQKLPFACVARARCHSPGTARTSWLARRRMASGGVSRSGTWGRCSTRRCPWR